MSVSWFMRIVNESIARQANQEDDCTGSFWESRFKNQALLDERALLSCMAYVDLNPIRANMANTPEQSEHTSVSKRIELAQRPITKSASPKALEAFVGIKEGRIGIPFKLDDYLDLVDWTGRIIRPDKRGSIEAELPPILQRLHLDDQSWKTLTTEFETQFQHWVGSEHIVRKVCTEHGYKHMPNTSAHRALFPT